MDNQYDNKRKPEEENGYSSSSSASQSYQSSSECRGCSNYNCGGNN